MDFNKLASQESINKTIAALKDGGMEAMVAQDEDEAKQKALSLIPAQAEVLTMASVTLDSLGLSEEINQSGKFNAVRTKLAQMDRNSQSLEMQKLGSAPEYVVGSVHAVTEDGKVFIASNTGSQLPAYAYGSAHVIWVVGTQKIVRDADMAMKRIYEYTLPLESERAKKAYGMPGSAVNKLLIIDKEFMPGRITIIFVKENLGF